MLTVHHLDNSRSHRILWLVEELDVPYEIREYKRGRAMRAPKALRDVHALGKSPVVTLDDGTVLAESGAIIEELVESFGPQLQPERATEAFRRYRYFLHYVEGSLMPPLLVKLIFNQVRTGPIPFFIKPIAKAIANKVDAAYTDPEIALNFGFLEAELADREYLCGEQFTGADIQLGFPLEAARARAGGFDDYPNLRAYLERTQARPAYQRATELGGAIQH